MTIYEHNYFSSINTYEKAYILGLILFNIKENCSDKIIVEINFAKEKINNYKYYKNIDKIIEIFKKFGKVQFNCDNNTIELTISSLYIIKDIFVKHLDLYLVNTKHYDLSLYINTIYNADKNLLNNFVKAYIEKNGEIANGCLYIKIYNYNTLKRITEIYKTPHKVLKEDCNDCGAGSGSGSGTGAEELYILEYKNSNMIDFLGQIYINGTAMDDLHMNDDLYNFLENPDSAAGATGEAGSPELKIYKADADAVVPSKNNYSDAGLDLTIIKEYKRLNSDTVLYDTGIKLEIPNGYYVEIVPRSSISRSGYILANSVGIIDQGYTGNLYVALRKINKDCEDLVMPYKCCQIIMKKQIYPKIVIEDIVSTETDSHNNSGTSRGSGGFGSTDATAVTAKTKVRIKE
jgi:deoxyuridine 5'-triphosphate nucleotidohydrolase